MARIVRQTGGWLWWIAGAVCTLVFGRGLAGEAGSGGAEPRPPSPAAGADPGKETDRPEPRLEDSAEWKAIVEAWKLAKPMADSGRSTRAQRREAAEKLAEAGEAAERLVRAGLLAAAEAALLADEAGKIKAEINLTQPTDDRPRMSCYVVALPNPLTLSFERLARRLPLLEELVRRGKVSREVANRVLATFEGDLRTLSARGAQEDLVRWRVDAWIETWGRPEDKDLPAVTANERADLDKTLRAAREALRKVKELAAGRPGG
jgi:hypothetical protein